jgi:hypothetical protein
MALNWIAIVGAAIAGFFVGWGWYALFGKPWMRALGWSEEQCKERKMPLLPMAIALVANLAMAALLGCFILDFGIETHLDALLLAGVTGVAFILTTTATNNAFQGRSHILTAIDSGHWIVVLLVQAAILVSFP